METSFSGLLRWLLLAIGVLIVAGVYWVSRRNAADKVSAARVPPDFPRDVVVPPAAGSSPGEAAAPPDEESIGEPAEPYIPQAAPGGGEIKSRLLVVHVQSKSQHKFAGADIVRIAEQAGLERAAGNNGGFFQRRVSPPDNPPLFYMANMFSPGVFEWSKMESFSTAGLSLFAQLPGALTPLETFDELVKCARLFADGLHGAVLDDSRSDLTAQTIQHIREDLQAYAMGRARSK